MKKTLISIYLMLLTCAYPCAFIYFQNVGEGSLKETILPYCIFLGTAISIMLLTFPFVRSLEKAAFFSCLFMLMFMNFNLVNAALLKISSFFKGTYMLVFYMVCYAALLLYLRKSKRNVLLLCEVLIGVWGLLILLNGIIAIPAIVKKVTFKNENVLDDLADMESFDAEKVNVYYFIFDEYGGPLGLEYYYDFKNDEFVQFLEKTGFVCSDTSYNRESIDTVDIIPNVLNLNYVAEIGGTTENNMKYTENPILYQIFESMGYQINMVNHRNALGDEGCKVISKFQGNDRMDTISDYILNQSLVYNLQIRLAPEMSSVSKYAEGLLSALNDMKYAWQEAQDQLTFTVCYIQCPHAGFVFDKDGNRIPEADSLNWTDKKIYIEQLTYLNKWIEETVELIQENDPEAVIVLQSDHGVRYAKHCMYLYSEQEYDPVIETDYMQNILNCVFWGERDGADIEGLSAINTWRTVLNVLFDSNFEMLMEPYGYVYEWKKADGIQ